MIMKLWLIGAVAWALISAWQVMPLDMSASDPEAKAAYDAAIGHHLLHASALGAGVPAFFYGLTRWLFRSRSDQTEAATKRAANSGPRRILLMRHAEKTGDPNDIHLSDAGRVRAERLVQYIPATFGRPDFIFAAARSKRSIRSIETLQPLAASLGLNVNYDIEDKDFGTLIDQLQSDPALNGSTVVICWHHGKLPEIADALGAPRGSYPDPWDDTVFNLILDVKYDTSGQPAVDRIIEPF